MLCYYRAIKWTSYARESDTGLGDSVKSSMQLLFDDLEKEHGASIIVKSLGKFCGSARFRSLLPRLYREQNYLDHDLDCGLDQEILSRVNT